MKRIYELIERIILDCINTLFQINYLLLFSLFAKNFPRIFIARVLSVFDDSMVKIVLTHSNSTAFPVFLFDGVLVATLLHTIELIYDMTLLKSVLMLKLLKSRH